MIDARQFVAAASRRGFGFYAGVPCSYLTPFINYVIDDPALRYVASANEGDAVAAAAGAFIGGRPGVAMMQNSGLGNAISPLTSLTHVFRIPVLIVCTHRGAPGAPDEPQHELMGEITRAMFETIKVPAGVFPAAADAIEPAFDRAATSMRATGRPYALVMGKGAVAPHARRPRTTVARPPRATVHGDALGLAPGARLARATVLTRLVELTGDARTVVIATTGYTGRELYAIADRPGHFYMVGSMGCASSLGLGLALARPELRVVVVDGDGAALMRMGNLATAGTYGPANFLHLLLDNEAHDSTGAQATVAANVDFAAVAAACGYSRVLRGETLGALEAFFAGGAEPGARFLHLKIRTGTLPQLPRPAITPAEVLQRLMAHIGPP